jgi:hypothetical protein
MFLVFLFIPEMGTVAAPRVVLPHFWRMAVLSNLFLFVQKAYKSFFLPFLIAFTAASSVGDREKALIDSERNWACSDLQQYQLATWTRHCRVLGAS